MRIKLLSFILLFIFLSTNVLAWGKIGHRVVGEVASSYLNKKAQKRVTKILECHSMAEVSNWMDDIKSDTSYDYAETWHWSTVPEGKTYEESEQDPQGDLISTIKRLVKELKAGGLSHEDEAQKLKMLIHLVGDIHQPLHIGNGEDLGGNKVQVKWFWGKSNLHRVWDSEMIDGKQYSFTELAEIVNNTSKEEVKLLQSQPIEIWYQESIALRPQVYDYAEDGELGYEYSYKNWETVKSQLMKGGIRLAGILNEIYG